MCGIAGILCPESSEQTAAGLQESLDLMKERGPDYSAVWSKQGCHLGHTRLSIIDLDPRSHQPFLLDQGRLALVFNGEIYNFRKLRQELEEKGHHFTTDSDTEVIARGYREWGEKVTARLDGMFAFALADFDTRTVLLARDPTGQKPLYFHRGPDRFIFASDIRVVRQLSPKSFTLNLSSIDYYLSELSVPQPQSVWNEVEQLPPATLARLDLDTLEMTDDRYWTVPYQALEREEEAALDRLEETLVQAILKRTYADVPLGCFLSGGVDSGLIVSLLAAHSDERVKTFTISLEGHSMDESRLARVVAERYDTDHTEVVVTADLEDITRHMAGYCGEPFADSSIIPSYLICREISQHVRVALSGDGGDELFGGYNDYLHAFKTDDFLERYPHPARRAGVVLADKVVSRLRSRENLGSLEHYARLSGGERMYRQIGFNEAIKRRLWRKDSGIGEFRGRDWLQQIWDGIESQTLSDHIMRASLSTRLVNDYLVKVDRSSMANSLEVRSPFLDRDLFALAFSLDPKLKFKGSRTKYLLKRLAQKYFDPKIFERPKTGFSIPLDEWFSGGNFRFAVDILASHSSWIYELFDYSQVRSLWRTPADFRRNAQGLWTLICLEIWARQAQP